MFITIEDYRKRIRDKALMEMIENSPEILQDLQEDAQSFIETHLRAKFDVKNIFNQTGSDRHRDIVIIMIDIVIYYLTMRVSPKQAQEIRVKLYEDAVKWLDNVSKGKISPDLPIFEPEVNKPSGFRISSSQEKQNFYF